MSIFIFQEIAIGLLVTPPAALGMISKREFIDLQIFKTYPEDDMNKGIYLFVLKIKEKNLNAKISCLKAQVSVNNLHCLDYGEIRWIFGKDLKKTNF